MSSYITSFLWFMVGFFVMSILEKVYYLADGYIPKRTEGDVAFGLVIAIILLIWVILAITKIP